MVLTSSDYNKLNKGDIAPSLELKGTDDKEHKLSRLKGEKATLIVFMCNHCPYVIPKLHELNRIYKEFKDKGLNVIGINPNNNPEYPEDSFENMKKLDVDFPYLFDETQEIAKAYGAVCTPDPFLFDKDLKLVFHSRIDDSHGKQNAEKHEMYDSIKELLEIGKITKKENPSMGCSIKWQY
jgi:peroxiredoxin